MRAILFASLPLAVLTLAPAARADFATPPGEAVVMLPRDRVVRPAVAAAPEEHLWIAAKFEGGPSFRPHDPMGGYGRFTVDLVSTGERETGFAYGFWYGFEGWGAPKIGGVTVPLVAQIGVKTTHFVALVGGGLNVLTLDKLSDGKGGGTYGGGIFTPRASARIGLHFEPLYVVATADVHQRWQWGLPDATVFQAGLAIGVMAGTFKGPAREARTASGW